MLVKIIRYAFRTKKADFRQSQVLSEFEYEHAVNVIQQISGRYFD